MLAGNNHFVPFAYDLCTACALHSRAQLKVKGLSMPCSLGNVAFARGPVQYHNFLGLAQGAGGCPVMTVRGASGSDAACVR